MQNQWFGKPFLITLVALVACFLLAIGVFHNAGQLVALAAIGVGIFVLTLWRLEFGIYSAFAELFANSHGHLIETPVHGFNLSLREVVFLSVMLAWVFLVVFRKAKFSLKDSRLVWFIPLFVAVIIGYVVGFAQNDPRIAFDDGNAYFYLAYLFPIISVEWNNSRLRALLQVLAAAATWVVFLTLGLLYEFTHFSGQTLVYSYKFIRDTRTGELTRMTDSIFRIFLQAQFSPIIFTFLLAPWLWLKESSRKNKILLTLGLSILISSTLISLSRSFWVGILAGLLLFFVLLFKIEKPGLKRFFSSSGLGVLSVIIGAIILVLIVLFPFPKSSGSAGELTGLLSSRTGVDDVAVSSRWKLLPAMWNEILSAPILGSGFGEEVTFVTDDPYALTVSPDGTWTVYTFEWGWLDLWLKMGILGPLAFLWLFWGLQKGILTEKGHPSWLTIGLLSGIVMLFVTHIFSPYLNHPIGLGFLLFVVPFLKTEKIQFPIRLPASVSLKAKPPALSSPVVGMTKES